MTLDVVREIRSCSMTGSEDAYLAREARARKKIDDQLVSAGCVVQGKDEIDVYAAQGVAIRELALKRPHGPRRLPAVPIRKACRGDRGQARGHDARGGGDPERQVCRGSARLDGTVGVPAPIHLRVDWR